MLFIILLVAGGAFALYTRSVSQNASREDRFSVGMSRVNQHAAEARSVTDPAVAYTALVDARAELRRNRSRTFGKAIGEGRAMHGDGLFDRVEMVGDRVREAAGMLADAVGRMSAMRAQGRLEGVETRAERVLESLRIVTDAACRFFAARRKGISDEFAAPVFKFAGAGGGDGVVGVDHVW